MQRASQQAQTETKATQEASRTPAPASERPQLPRAFSGNRAALRRLSLATPTLPCKLTVGAVNDPLEAEADRAAEQVMRMPDPAASPAGRTGAPAPGWLNSSSETRSAPEMQNDGVSPGHEAPPSVHEVLDEPGRPLHASTRAFFEPRFGRDLSQVRIHNDSKAAESARAIDALAFTGGNNIVFASGSYRPDHPEGRFILAHELAHTLQQGRQPTIRRIIRSSTNAPLDSYLRGKSISGFASAGGAYSMARGTKATFSEQEVLLDMLASPRLFEVAGDSSADAEKSLTDHVMARLGIVTFASQKRYSFASVSGFKMNPKYWDVDPNTQSWKLKPGVDKQAAWDDVNQNPQEYAIGCQAATIISQAGGAKGARFRDQPSTDENDWVPGDGGYVSNPKHPKQGGPGTLGENLIYMGSGQFWGHLPGDVAYRTLAEWKKEVALWDGASQVDSMRDGPVTGLL